MSKPVEKRKAIELRTGGLSYNEIRRHVPVAKSTLSLWLRSVGLATPQRQRLTEKKLAAARRGGQKVHAERLARVRRIMAEAESEVQRRLGMGDWLWLVGAVLYWGEGAKPKVWRSAQHVQFTNMDPDMIILMRQWLIQRCGVSASSIHYSLYIHEKADIPRAQLFWAERIGVQPGGVRTYFKRHNASSRRRNTGQTYYGTMRIDVRRSTDLNRRIAGWIKGLLVYCGVG